MSDHLDLLRRIAESPTGLIVPRRRAREAHAPMEELMVMLNELARRGLIVSVRVVQAQGNPLGPVGFSASITPAGRASLASAAPGPE